MAEDFTLTLRECPHKISPESSDGFASVGTILPIDEAALLPGGLVVVSPRLDNSFCVIPGVTLE